MNFNALLHEPASYFSKIMLVAFIAICSVSCGGPQLDKKEEDLVKRVERELHPDKRIIIPKIQDTSSIYGNLIRKLPLSYVNSVGDTTDILADTTKLCIKGNSAWMEYCTTVLVHRHKKDGSIKLEPQTVAETTDAVYIK